MYYEAQPAGGGPSSVRTAVSADWLTFTPELGGQPLLAHPERSYGSPRCVYMPDGSARLYAHTRAALAANETATLLRLPLPLVGASIVVEGERQQNDSSRQRLRRRSRTELPPSSPRWPRPAAVAVGETVI